MDPSEDPGPETVLKGVGSDASPALWTEDRRDWIERLCRACPIPLWIGEEYVVVNSD